MTCVSFDWFNDRKIDIKQDNNTLNITLDQSFIGYSLITGVNDIEPGTENSAENSKGTPEHGQEEVDSQTHRAAIGFENIDHADTLSDQQLIFHVAMHQVFQSRADITDVCVQLPGTAHALRTALLATGALIASPDGTLICERSVWSQLPDLWLAPQIAQAYPLRYDMTDGKRHPIRRPIPDGTVYLSHATAMGQTFRLKKVDLDRDLPTFHEWMNQKRVDHFWEESGDLAHHKAYLEKALLDPKVLPMIGFFDDEPIGYFEAYWIKEDRLAPYCNGTDFDRGMHLLIGNPNYLGKDFNNIWLPAVLHYMFLEDCRTQRLLGEPRSDNKRLIRRLVDLGFYMEKAFDFPHKHAALMVISREVFFQNI